MKTSHTPAPWSFEIDDMNIYNAIGTGICTIHTHAKIVGIDDIEKAGKSITTIANAKLIAAAPDLLEALKYCVAVFEAQLDQNESYYKQAVEAIKKATE